MVDSMPNMTKNLAFRTLWKMVGKEGEEICNAP